MGSKWKKIKLSEAVNFRNGAGIKQTFFTEKKDGIPLVKVSNFTLDSVDTSQSMTLVDNAHAENWKSHLLNTDDILIATVGSWPPNWSSVVGKVVRVPPEAANMLQNQNTCCLIPNEDIDSNYLFYVLKSKEFQDWVVNTAQGSANQARVPINMLGHYEISLPEIFHQRNISNFISKLDTKIRINKNINSILENISKALFKSWFVDFDPVIDNALDAGNSIPEVLQSRAELRQKVRNSADFKPLSADIRALFPAEFEETELGWVPKGWMLESVAKSININPSVKLPKNTVAKYVDMKSLPTQGYSISDVIEKPYAGGAKFQKNDTLFARITPCLENGKTGFVDFLDEQETAFGSTEFIVMRGTTKVHYSYVACLARENNFRLHAIQNMVGSSGRQRVQNSCFDSFYIAVPTPSVMSLFAGKVSSYFDKMYCCNMENKSLTNLRDTLLPKLISGELSLEDLPNLVAQTEPA